MLYYTVGIGLMVSSELYRLLIAESQVQYIYSRNSATNPFKVIDVTVERNLEDLDP